MKHEYYIKNREAIIKRASERYHSKPKPTLSDNQKAYFRKKIAKSSGSEREQLISEYEKKYDQEYTFFSRPRHRKIAKDITEHLSEDDIKKMHEDDLLDYSSVPDVVTVEKYYENNEFIKRKGDSMTRCIVPFGANVQIKKKNTFAVGDHVALIAHTNYKNVEIINEGVVIVIDNFLSHLYPYTVTVLMSDRTKINFTADGNEYDIPFHCAQDNLHRKKAYAYDKLTAG